MARTTYVQVKQPDGSYKLIEKSKYRPPSENKSAMVMGDIDPYKSTITGETIGGRAQHRKHLKQHGCVEVGNEPMGSAQKHFEKPKLSKRELTNDVRRAFDGD